MAATLPLTYSVAKTRSMSNSATGAAPEFLPVQRAARVPRCAGTGSRSTPEAARIALQVDTRAVGCHTKEAKALMDKYEAIQYLLDKCVVAVVRADTGGDDLVRVVEAVAEGGVHCIEVTMTTPGALMCIETASKRLSGADVLLGVGSVLDPETCRMAILAG
ncbi:MAG TPA: hypothetical protein ENN80_06100, partial [Candidatus Hydrogenedentes bacterium]|nr:hypothetical protein [Candidatus Hydrogenedentota bacterium]